MVIAAAPSIICQQTQQRIYAGNGDKISYYSIKLTPLIGFEREEQHS